MLFFTALWACESHETVNSGPMRFSTTIQRTGLGSALGLTAPPPPEDSGYKPHWGWHPLVANVTWLGVPLPWPATGTMASAWSDNSRLKPLIADNLETTMKELYGEQERWSGPSLNPLAQAQENIPPGVGRQICWQAFGLLLQPLEESAAPNKRIQKSVCNLWTWQSKYKNKHIITRLAD